LRQLLIRQVSAQQLTSQNLLSRSKQDAAGRTMNDASPQYTQQQGMATMPPARWAHCCYIAAGTHRCKQVTLASASALCGAI